MSEVLRQSLSLTAWGMGMTFASIGALAIGMYLLTLLTRGQSIEASREQPDDEMGREDAMTLAGEPVPDEEEARRRATAAAVAVACALAEAGRPVAQTPVGTYPAGDQAWNSYARGLHLSRRANYDLRRARR